MRFPVFLGVCASVALMVSGCESLNDAPRAPDYRIQVVPSPDGNGYIAIPPTCPDWRTETTDPWDNNPWPQYGCATQRNLAMMIDRPEDLVRGRDLSAANGTVVAAGMARYQKGKTTALVDPNSSTPVQSSVVDNGTGTYGSMGGDKN